MKYSLEDLGVLLYFTAGVWVPASVILGAYALHLMGVKL